MDGTGISGTLSLLPRCLLQNSPHKVFRSWLWIRAQQLVRLRPGCSRAPLWCKCMAAVALSAHQGDSCPGSCSCTSLHMWLSTHPRVELACAPLQYKAGGVGSRKGLMAWNCDWSPYRPGTEQGLALASTGPCTEEWMFLCLSDYLPKLALSLGTSSSVTTTERSSGWSNLFNFLGKLSLSSCTTQGTSG